ncbi:MAG: NosD domain-containing protein [Candidatus Heimdallarchaeaceae archaeon]
MIQVNVQFLIIENNTCSDNADNGISVFESSNNSINNNTCIDNRNRGIAINYVEDTTIENNNCSNNGQNSIYSDGSINLTITRNECIESYYGMRITATSNSSITYNRIELNTGYGVVLGVSAGEHCVNVSIHHNSFVNNPVQAVDSASNTWYDTSLLEGNFWSDWSGVGSYVFNGNSDPYPLSASIFCLKLVGTVLRLYYAHTQSEIGKIICE